jgi:hypothetical protein
MGRVKKSTAKKRANVSKATEQRRSQRSQTTQPIHASAQRAHKLHKNDRLAESRVQKDGRRADRRADPQAQRRADAEPRRQETGPCRSTIYRREVKELKERVEELRREILASRRLRLSELEQKMMREPIPTKKKELQHVLAAEEAIVHARAAAKVSHGDIEMGDADRDSDHDVEMGDAENAENTSNDSDWAEEILRSDVQAAKAKWPRVISTPMKLHILDLKIAEMLKLLRRKRTCPHGQDWTKHFQTLCFMRAQRAILGGFKRKKDRTHITKVQQQLGCTRRKAVALWVALCFGRTTTVQRRLMRDERIWIREGRIPEGHQGMFMRPRSPLPKLMKATGKANRLSSLLEDEGVKMVVQEYTAGAEDKISAEGLRKAIASYIGKPENGFEERDGLVLSRTVAELQRPDRIAITDDSAATPNGKGRSRKNKKRFRKVKKGLCVRTMERWLHAMGFNWKEVRKGDVISIQHTAQTG